MGAFVYLHQSLHDLLLSQHIQKMRRRLRTVVEVVDSEKLVRSARVTVGQAKAQHQGIRAENLLEQRQDRQRTAFANQDRPLAERSFDPSTEKELSRLPP